MFAVLLAAAAAAPAAPVPPPPARPVEAARPPGVGFWAPRGLLTPERGAALVARLGGPDYDDREAAERALAAAGWEGFLVARHAAATDPRPEAARRAARVAAAYLSVPPPPSGRTPCICALVGTRMATRTTPADADTILSGEIGRQVVYWYFARAAAAEHDARGHAPGGRRWSEFGNDTEVWATRLLCADLLAAGVSREWVGVLLAAMDGRHIPWPPGRMGPPKWIAAVHGIDPDY